METDLHKERHVIRKTTLTADDTYDAVVGKTAADRLMMMWRIAQDCWAFTPGHDAKREFQRHVARVERSGR